MEVSSQLMVVTAQLESEKEEVAALQAKVSAVRAEAEAVSHPTSSLFALLHPPSGVKGEGWLG